MRIAKKNNAQVYEHNGLMATATPVSQAHIFVMLDLSYTINFITS